MLHNTLEADVSIFPLAFCFEVRFGRCVGVRLPPSIDAAVLAKLLDPEERGLCRAMKGARLVEFVGGRVASRLARLGMPGQERPTLKGASGEPHAGGISLSLSHSRRLAVALASAEAGCGVGVDIEHAARVGPEGELLTERILSKAERHALPGVRAIDIVQRLSIKEAVYKAVFSLAGTPIPLRQISVGGLVEGRKSEFQVCLEREGVRAESISFRVEEHFLSLARAQLSR